MLKREKLLDILKTRFDYYAAQAVFNEVVATVGLRDVETLDAAAVKGVTAYLEKLSGTRELIERLAAFAATPAPVVAAEPAPVAPEAPAAEPAPVADDTPPEAAPDDGAKKKKKK